MTKIEKNALYLTTLFYVGVGIAHFLFPSFLISIMPPEIPMKETVVYLSGAIEILLGFALLNKKYRSLAAQAIVLMLLSYLWVHIYMYLNKEVFIDEFDMNKYTDNPSIFFVVRILLQFVFIYWISAFIDSKKN